MSPVGTFVPFNDASGFFIEFSDFSDCGRIDFVNRVERIWVIFIALYREPCSEPPVHAQRGLVQARESDLVPVQEIDRLQERPDLDRKTMPNPRLPFNQAVTNEILAKPTP